MEKQWKQWQTIFLGSKIIVDVDCSHEVKRCLLLGRKAMKNLDRILKSREITLQTIVYNQSSGFSGSHVQMWELNHKEGWVPKNWWFQTVMLENTLENPLNSEDIKPVNPKGHQPWIFIGKTDAEAPIFWSPDGKSQLIGKDPGAGKDWGQEEKGAAEDETVGRHHHPVHWEHRMLTTGLPGKSQFVAFCDHTAERLLAVFMIILEVS